MYSYEGQAACCGNYSVSPGPGLVAEATNPCHSILGAL